MIFSFAYFDTKTATSLVHTNRFYEAVNFLYEGGFKVYFGLFDGAAPSRSFFECQFKNMDAVSCLFTTINRVIREPLVLIMDPLVCNIAKLHIFE